MIPRGTTTLGPHQRPLSVRSQRPASLDNGGIPGALLRPGQPGRFGNGRLPARTCYRLSAGLRVS